MTHKRIVAAVLFVGLLVIGLGVWLISPFSNAKVNRATFDLIDKGMTLSEVQTLLGGPPRDYTRGRRGAKWEHTLAFSRVPPFIVFAGDPFHVHTWTSYEGYISLLFDRHGKVIGKFYDEVMPINESDGVIDWLRLILLRSGFVI
jgi:hypothetical protein